MIPYDFAYHRISTAEEAVKLHQSLREQGRRPYYYAGGTELITLGRLSEVYADAVIDIKGIAECQTLQLEHNQLFMGAALPLAKIQESRFFPLLGQTISEIADQTARNKITLGGNLCGHIYYREAVLPLLIADSEAVIEGKSGRRRAPLNSIFDGRPQLEEGELLVQLITQSDYLELPYYTVKKRRQWDIGYPLITVAALKKDGKIRLAISGVCPFPFRSERLEEILNNHRHSPETRIEQAVQLLPQPISGDVEGSPEYRIFVLKNTLLDALQALEGEAHAHS
ncbi:FAD binding domain-containing protein [Paenibacillus alkaliterrae]|uniref:FAD binding domain-containing protein n=1 Tax=Paenibacillus alkaliterrae TaxID=320909 RepID=UPI001F471808|nr:FAD binding domain-containing protein [Paenibacillus alkaliterrae]MCF2941669.1 FAD binding domain-containing protein [Paenibacillus alkaliterrae]